MSVDRNPQAQQMADESMVRNLAAQAEAIWPQEEPIVRAHRLPAAPAILDVGCGTGEITSRLAELFPAATITGVDIVDHHLELARRRYAALGDRVRFEHADAFELPFGADRFDLVVCRHMLQAIPDADKVLAELVRVARPGGALHLIVEDYGMIHVAPRPGAADPSAFWSEAPWRYAAATGVDLHIGRNTYHHLRALPVADIRVHYVTVDTIRVPRPTFAAIFTAWRDGYTETIAHELAMPIADVQAIFAATIDAIEDPAAYVVWHVPVVTAVKR